MKIKYNPRLTSRASKLRRKGRTYAERMLWHCLRNRRVRGYKFMRQKPIGNFITDFFCLELKLVIEIDGISHEGKEAYDKRRVNYLKSLGLNILRFDDERVKDDLEGVLVEIENYIKSFLQTNK
ncbi:MAG: endonuclease domain-containing protein [Candidatus Magasanikbacteria bacterium]|nr:endonuclease domain-containing protein [Candidatus Magasanikbacteria bacterium]MBI5221939.1 endonuclease domain-containing protein [Candidatus Magasanikbacteria bacterium]